MNILIVLALTLVWIILVESLAPIALIAGVVISVCCVVFGRKYLPLQKVTGVNFSKLATYPLFLLGQVLSASIYVSRIILFGAKTDIVDVETNLENDSLRVLLADSVTLTPGSLVLELQDEKFTILWLRPGSAPNIEQTEDPGGQIMSTLENRLMKAQIETPKTLNEQKTPIAR